MTFIASLMKVMNWKHFWKLVKSKLPAENSPYFQSSKMIDSRHIPINIFFNQTQPSEPLDITSVEFCFHLFVKKAL